MPKSSTISQWYVFYITNAPLSLVAAAFALLIYFSIIFERRKKHNRSHISVLYSTGPPIWGPFKLIPYLMVSIIAKAIFHIIDGLKFVYCYYYIVNSEAIQCLATHDTVKSCRARGAIRLVFEQSVFMWVLCMAYDVYSIVVKRKRQKPSVYICVGYVIPTVYGVVAYVWDFSGATNLVKCWLRIDDVTHIIYIWLSYYVPLLSCWFFALYFVLKAEKKHRLMVRNITTEIGCNANYGYNSNITYFKRVVYVFLIVRIMSLVDACYRIIDYINGKHAILPLPIQNTTVIGVTTTGAPFDNSNTHNAFTVTFKEVLGFLHNFFVPLEGFVLSIVILNAIPMRQAYLMQKCKNICRFCCFFWCINSVHRTQSEGKEDDDDYDNDSGDEVHKYGSSFSSISGTLRDSVLEIPGSFSSVLSSSDKKDGIIDENVYESNGLESMEPYHAMD
jgi:hypothetical protein